MNRIKRIIIGAILGVLISFGVVYIINQLEHQNITTSIDDTLMYSFDAGYWRGVNDMLVYAQEHNLFRTDTTITIHLEELIETNQKERELYYDKINTIK